MTSPYREVPVSRLWECGSVIIDLDRIVMCEWGMSDDDCGCDYDDPEPHKVLNVFFMGDDCPLNLTISEGQQLVEAWKAYRRA